MACLSKASLKRGCIEFLYYLRFLRAMIFNIVFSIIAAVLYMLFGVTGLYPGAAQLIDTLKAQSNQAVPFNIVIFTSIISVILISFFIISYLSVTMVWRKTLKAQSIFYGLGVILAMPALTLANTPVLENASWLFTSLLLLYLTFTCWFCGDLVIALWSVSRTPEVSSLRATLDTRLHSGSWALMNKLLDLPRTPLRSWRALISYVLSLAGAIGLVMSLVYFLSIGGVYNKAGQLMFVCDKDPDECFSQSQMWASWTLFWVLVSLAGIKVSLTVQAIAKRMAALAVHVVLKDPKQEYVLYLRSFGTDDVRLPRPKLPLLSRIVAPWPFLSRVEEELFDVADGYLPLIAVGRPGPKRQAEGGIAYREYLPDKVWQSYVEERIQNAKQLVLLLNTTEGVLWELKHVLALGAGPKTLFLFDPRASDRAVWESIKDSVLPIFVQEGLFSPKYEFFAQVIAFYFAGVEVVQIENSNWSASSYRTAISYFLSENAVPHRG